MNLNALIDSTILITGATGLIGKAIVKRLLLSNIKVIAVVRNKEKAEKILGPENVNLHYMISDVMDIAPQNLNVNYIIHAASKTSSKSFISEPVETILTAFIGTKNLLEFASLNPIKGFIYLSTMEVYGTPITDEKITENHYTNLDSMKTRSCYPESKRMCENLCVSYASEYSIPVKIVRLTQTFGPGVQYNDSRVFAEFARCVIENKDIILNTKGETKRNYLYTEDAVNAILTVMLNGKVGEAYNAANEDTYCSIYDMACLVAEKCAKNKIGVKINNTSDLEQHGYAPTLKMNLDTSKLKKIGWKPTVDLVNMFNNMIFDMKMSISKKD